MTWSAVEMGVGAWGGELLDRDGDQLYHVTMITRHRTQTGVRIETSLLKVLKGLAEYKNISLGDLLEGIVLHAFESRPPFSGDTLAVIEKLRDVYGCTLTADDAHKIRDASGERSSSEADH